MSLGFGVLAGMAWSLAIIVAFPPSPEAGVLLGQATLVGYLTCRAVRRASTENPNG